MPRREKGQRAKGDKAKDQGKLVRILFHLLRARDLMLPYNLDLSWLRSSCQSIAGYQEGTAMAAATEVGATDCSCWLGSDSHASHADMLEERGGTFRGAASSVNDARSKGKLGEVNGG